MALGDIEFRLRRGKMESRKNSPDKFVPDVVYISGVNVVLEIEKSCRIRIKENDSTPIILINKDDTGGNILFN